MIVWLNEVVICSSINSFPVAEVNDLLFIPGIQLKESLFIDIQVNIRMYDGWDE